MHEAREPGNPPEKDRNNSAEGAGTPGGRIDFSSEEAVDKETGRAAPADGGTAEGPRDRERAGLLDFVVPHDGSQPEIPVEEQLIVAEKFRSLLDDTFLNFAGDVRRVPRIGNVLNLERPIDEKSRFSITLEDTSGVPESDPDISSTEYDAMGIENVVTHIGVERVSEGHDHEEFGYRLYNDGVVRRWTSGDTDNKIWLGITPTTITDGMSLGEALDAEEQSITEIVANRNLEQQLGYQLQSVGLPELDGLADFLRNPAVVPKQAA